MTGANPDGSRADGQDRTTPFVRDAEEARREASRYRALVHAMATISVTAAPDGSFVEPQIGWQAFTGQPFAEHRGLGWLEVVHPDDRDAGRASFAEAVQRRVWFERRMRIRHAGSGEFRWCELRAVPVEGESGAIEEWWGIAVDVHAQTLVEIERRRLEAELRASEGHFRVLAEALPQLVWTARPDGSVDSFNGRWYAYTGATAERHLGWGWREVIADHARDEALALYRRALEKGTTMEADLPLRGADGVHRWFLVRAEPLRGDDGAIVQWFGTATDVDERRRLAEELVEANRQKNRFLAMLSHELRNPLAPIRNAADVLRARSQDAEAVEWAGAVVDRQVRHLSRLVDDLLDVSRIVEGKIVLRREPIPLAQALATAIEIVRPKLDERAQDLRVSLPAVAVPVDVDPTRFAQIVANLLDNASKFSDPGATIDVEGTVEGASIALRVRDPGVGIAPDLRSEIFELFTQADASLARSQGGLGIGLTLVRHLVELHGGTVEVSSEGHGRGSTFTVRLPVATTARPAPTPGAGSAAPGTTLRVLVVDDSADAADSLALLLETLGHRVRVAYDGPTASAVAADFRPDLALVDVGLPGMDGYEVCAGIRRELGSGVRLVAVTGYGRPEDRVRALRAGFDGHLVKPVELDRLEPWLEAEKLDESAPR